MWHPCWDGLTGATRHEWAHPTALGLSNRDGGRLYLMGKDGQYHMHSRVIIRRVTPKRSESWALLPVVLHNLQADPTIQTRDGKDQERHKHRNWVISLILLTTTSAIVAGFWGRFSSQLTDRICQFLYKLEVIRYLRMKQVRLVSYDYIQNTALIMLGNNGI